MLFVELELGKKEEINLSKYTKEKIEFYSKEYDKSEAEYLSSILENHFSGVRHPKQENVHLTRLPKYMIEGNFILICEKGFEIEDIIESEDCDDKYIVEYRNIIDNETYYVDFDSLCVGINQIDSILCVPLASETDVYLSQEEKEFIGVD